MTRKEAISPPRRRRPSSAIARAAAWTVLALSSSSSDRGASSFSSPRSKPRRRPTASSRKIGYGRNDLLTRFPDGNANGTHWPDSQPATTMSSFYDAPFLNVVEPDSDSTAFERELLEGYIEQLSLLNAPTDQESSLERSVSISIIPEPDGRPDCQLDATAPGSIAVPIEQPPTTTPILTDVWKARLLLLLSAALYGTNFTMVKSLDESMSVGLSSTLRFGLAAFAMLPWLFAPIDDEVKALARERKNHESKSSPEKGIFLLKKLLEEPTRLSAMLAGMEIGFYNSIGYIAQAIGLKTTTASKSAFICSMAVVTVPILDKIWGKPLLRRQIVGACLAAAGVYALEIGGQESAFTDGDLMSLVQPLMFGLGFWRMEAAVERYPTEAGRLAAAQLLMVFLISLSYLVCWSPMLSDACSVLPTAPEVVAWLRDPITLGTLLWTGVVTTAFTIWMETLALKTLSAAETTLIFSTEPLFGAAFAAVVANECLGAEAAIGAAFIIGGCIVSGMDVGGFLSRAKLAAAEGTATDK